MTQQLAVANETTSHANETANATQNFNLKVIGNYANANLNIKVTHSNSSDTNQTSSTESNGHTNETAHPNATNHTSSSEHNGQTYEAAQADVGVEFRMVFEIIFYVCVVRICMYTLSYMVNSDLRRGLSSLQRIAAAITLFALFYGFYLRVTPRGQACADDFGKKTDEESGLLTEQGLFYKWGLVFVVVMILLSLLMTICGVLFHKRKGTEEEKQHLNQQQEMSDV